MPIRLPCKRITFGPGSLLHAYWGTAGLPRPVFGVYVVGPGNKVVLERAQIDTAADYSLLASGLGATLGLSLPSPRRYG
jgi:hypothetical protein